MAAIETGSEVFVLGFFVMWLCGFVISCWAELCSAVSA